RENRLADAAAPDPGVEDSPGGVDRERDNGRAGEAASERRPGPSAVGRAEDAAGPSGNGGGGSRVDRRGVRRVDQERLDRGKGPDRGQGPRLSDVARAAQARRAPDGEGRARFEEDRVDSSADRSRRDG